MASSRGFQSYEPIASDPSIVRTVEPRSHRGTGGVLRDLRERESQAFADVDYILVIDRDACPPHTLSVFVDELQHGADVVVGVSELDRLAGLIALKPSLLDDIPERGYVDLKEQVLNAALSNGRRGQAVTIMPRAIRIRNLSSWLEAVRYHSLNGGENSSSGTKGLQRSSVIAESAVTSGAFIVDSVVMENARVGEGAVVARSAIPPGMLVPDGAVVVDSVFFREAGSRGEK